jgi:hypothetical protein
MRGATRLLALASQQDRPPRAPIGVEFLRSTRRRMRVEAFSVIRRCSSSPSRRCAFSIDFALLLRRRLSEFQWPPIGVNKIQFIGPSLSVVDAFFASVLFHKRRQMLDRAPAGDVPVVALAEHAV